MAINWGLTEVIVHTQISNGWWHISHRCPIKNIILYHIISYYIILYHIISYYIILHPRYSWFSPHHFPVVRPDCDGTISTKTLPLMVFRARCLAEMQRVLGKTGENWSWGGSTDKHREKNGWYSSQNRVETWWKSFGQKLKLQTNLW